MTKDAAIEDVEEFDPEFTIEAITANTLIDGKQNYYAEIKKEKGNLLLYYWFKMNRAVNKLSSWSKMFLIVSIVLTVAVVVSAVANIIVNAIAQQPGVFYSHYMFNSLNIICTLILLIFCIQSIVQENEYLLVTYVLLTLLLTMRVVYVMVQTLIVMIQTKKDVKIIAVQVITNLLPGVLIILCQLFMLITVVPAFRSFGWKIYHIAGTSAQLIRCYRCYMLYVSFILVDWIGLITIFIMGLFYLKFDWWWTYIAFSAIFVLSNFTYLLTIYIGCQREWISVQVLFILFSLFVPGYLIYKIVTVYVSGDDRLQLPKGVTREEIITAKVILTTFAGLYIIWRVALIIMAIIVTCHFRKGLAEIFAKRREKKILKLNLKGKKKDGDNPLSENLLDEESSIQL